MNSPKKKVIRQTPARSARKARTTSSEKTEPPKMDELRKSRSREQPKAKAEEKESANNGRRRGGSETTKGTETSENKPSRKRKRAGGGQKKKVPVSPKSLRKLAREIFLMDIREEGTLLLNQKEAEKLAARSFEVAEVFLRESARRAPKKDSTKKNRRSPGTAKDQ